MVSYIFICWSFLKCMSIYNSLLKPRHLGQFCEMYAPGVADLRHTTKAVVCSHWNSRPAASAPDRGMETGMLLPRRKSTPVIGRDKYQEHDQADTCLSKSFPAPHLGEMPGKILKL